MIAVPSLERLATCDVRLQKVVLSAGLHRHIFVICGHRDQEEQHLAFTTGRSQKDWPYGNHNSYPSNAVDVAPYFLDQHSHIDWTDLVAFGRLMGYIQCVADALSIPLRFGLDWDGDWHTVGHDPNEHFLDAPHIELLELPDAQTQTTVQTQTPTQGSPA